MASFSSQRTRLSRRDALKTLAAGAAGFVVAARQDVDGQPGRRLVTVGGRRVRVIDCHAHCVIPVTDIVANTPLAAASVAPPSNIPGNILGPNRLRLMDEQGVDLQVLGINGYWWYAADRDLARAIVRAQNDGLATWVAANPDRFVALASVALQFPDLAAGQLDDAVKRLGMRGVSIGGHANGEDLSLPKFDPFWAKAAELGVVVLVHPGGADNVVKPGVLAGRGDLVNIIGNPLETTYCLSRLIYDGTFDKFPGLTVLASHAGGYLPSYLGRTEVSCAVRANANCANRKKPSEYLKSQIVLDTLVFSDEGLRHLVAEAGVSQIMYGTDVPYTWPATIDLVLDAKFLSDAEKVAILGGNAAARLKIAV